MGLWRGFSQSADIILRLGPVIFIQYVLSSKQGLDHWNKNLRPAAVLVAGLTKNLRKSLQNWRITSAPSGERGETVRQMPECYVFDFILNRVLRTHEHANEKTSTQLHLRPCFLKMESCCAIRTLAWSSLCSPGQHRTQEPSASASWILGSLVYITQARQYLLMVENLPQVENIH